MQLAILVDAYMVSFTEKIPNQLVVVVITSGITQPSRNFTHHH
jgi:hypothetical protein